MFCTYILYSKKLNSFYKGETGNIVDRLQRHNKGYEKATQSGVPWILVWKCEKITKSEAKILELKLKNLSVKRTIDFILKYKQYVPSSDELLLIQKLSECSNQQWSPTFSKRMLVDLRFPKYVNYLICIFLLLEVVP